MVAANVNIRGKTIYIGLQNRPDSMVVVDLGLMVALPIM